MQKIVLNEKDLIAKGGERACYKDPRDNTKVIKVLYCKLEHNQQNKLEYIYMDYLKQKEKDFSHITQCYGYVNTTIGKGLVFDRVMDFDLKPSKSLRYYIAHSLISVEEQKQHVEPLLTRYRQY